MSRLLCVGNSSTLPAKGTVPVRTGVIGSRESAVSKSVDLKTISPPRGKPPSVNSNGGQLKEHSSRFEAGAVLQALSQADVSMHGKENLPKQSFPDKTDKNIVSARCVAKVDQYGPLPKVPQHMEEPNCLDSPSTSEEESGEDEESEEETTENSAPIELLAEFLNAVMMKDYPLAKKLCQMILIYEPKNPEAKHFLPLIEERILTAEEAQEDSSCDEEETDDDDDDDDDDESSSTSSDEESTDSKS